jgi:putative transcriptional regulator
LVGLGAGRGLGQDDDTRYLVGRLLVATTEMRDPRFAETVIYMVRHDARGALGLVVNRPVAVRPLAEVLNWLGITTGDVEGDIRVYWGGPVAAEQGMVLHSDDYRTRNTQSVTDAIALTAQVEVLRDIAAGKGPRRYLFALGYAGWAAGQLESEIARGSWLSVAADDSLLFGQENERKWRRAMDKQGIDL